VQALEVGRGLRDGAEVLGAGSIRPADGLGLEVNRLGVGGYRLTIAGRDGSTGLPEVDAVIDQFGRAPGRVGGFP